MAALNPSPDTAVRIHAPECDDRSVLEQPSKQGLANVRIDPFEAAAIRADYGIEQSAAHAERDQPGWTEVALDALREFYKRQSGSWTVEAARVQLANVIPAPGQLRSWGHVTREALKRGFITPTGEFAAAASSNRAPKMKYTRGPNA